MNSKAPFSVLTVAIICLLPLTSGQTSYSMEHTSTSSSSNSTSSQQTVGFGSTEQFGGQGRQRDDGDQPSRPANLGASNSPPSSARPTPTTKEYEQDLENMGATPLSKNATYLAVSPSTDTPTPTVNCPGPIDVATGEGYVDQDGNCAIACYNNLVLNQAGDNCGCQPTFQLDPVEIKCGCPSPWVIRRGKCVLLPSQAVGRSSHKKRSLNGQIPFEVEMLHGKYPRTDVDRKNCPNNEIACPLSHGGFECVDPDVAIDNCGGCASTPKGVNCFNMTMPGLKNMGCNAGTCQAISCHKGYRLLDGKCIRNPRR